VTDRRWQPGDPLHEPTGYSAELPIFDLRDDVGDGNGIVSAAASKWPIPYQSEDLDHLDAEP
jgi:hypothetical protein